ncbi:hypothetical protein ACFFMR_23785 [Micromonospora andamanensis]|uniref:Uncharacterized protein n=1 Tax=Micromonospora andamanensis TaxID=1287068 RepID=A0ABQ4HU53_9ACTN|nr:hypothetical protein [Micromonospora andamanensis]GIJ09176.1 hypothetical protein Van01_23900 [Micromonospora andamanensis]
MPDRKQTPTHVLTAEAVRWGIEALASQRLHPTFVMYLHLRTQQRAGKLSEASASSDELLALIRMPGNPTKPYYFPLIDRGQRRPGELLSSFWRAGNIPGSWSPGSISRLKHGGWMGRSTGEYFLPRDHVGRALSELLYDVPVSALALGAYFLRNDGFIIAGTPGPSDLIEAFRLRFDYPDDAQEEFAILFNVDLPTNVDFDWFAQSDPPVTLNS